MNRTERTIFSLIAIAVSAVAAYFLAVFVIRYGMVQCELITAIPAYLCAAFGVTLLFMGVISRIIDVPYARGILLLSGLLISASTRVLFDFRQGLMTFSLFFVLLSAKIIGNNKNTFFRFSSWSVLTLSCIGMFGMLLFPRMIPQVWSPFAEVLCGVSVGLALIGLFLSRNAAEEADAKRFKQTAAALFPLALGIIADTILRSVHASAAGIGLLAGALLLTCVRVWMTIEELEEEKRRMLRMEDDLLQSRIAMMRSQIQPHFMANALTAIKMLCVSDPEKAEEAIGDFASYLRTNLDAMTKNAIIPLAKELQHIERYVRLERMRFGERVKIVYDLEYQAFSVPTLTIQPLVENAVRYGITKKPSGGTVTIRAYETDEAFIVTVTDDGVGFDTNAELSKDRCHVGIENARSRIEAQCAGTLSIESTIGVGTKATVTIPKREAE